MIHYDVSNQNIYLLKTIILIRSSCIHYFFFLLIVSVYRLWIIAITFLLLIQQGYYKYINIMGEVILLYFAWNNDSLFTCITYLLCIVSLSVVMQNHILPYFWYTYNLDILWYTENWERRNSWWIRRSAVLWFLEHVYICFEFMHDFFYCYNS